MIDSTAVQMAAAALTLWGANDEQRVALLGAGPDQAERIAHVLDVHAALRELFPDRELADRWPSTPNKAWDHAAH